MMQRWADHCSSDEDTDDNYSVEEEQVEEIEPTTIEEEFSDKVQVNTDDTASEEQPDQQQPVRTYDFPDRPPFTAFVGNLSYDIQDTAQLQQGLADVVLERLGEKVRVLGGRICYDRDNTSGQHRGFGYVELESLEELKIVMKLNDDGKATLAGRKIQVDTANHNNRSNNNYNRRGNNHRGSNHGDRRNNSNRDNESAEKIDGSKFRGGKFNNNNNNFRNSFRNNNHSNHSNHSNSNSNDANGPPRERPSLKLAPRSKPVDADRSSSSNIFGGAKARDEQAWAKSRHQQKEDQKRKTPESPAVEEKKTIKNKDEDHNNKEDKNSSIRRESGRGAGRGGKGRGNQHRNSNNAGRGGDSNHKRGAGKRQPNDKKNDKKKQPASSEEKALPAKPIAKTADAPSSNPEPKKPKNKFALLMDDSDSD